MKILVTGSTGFIGNNLVRELLSKSYEVAVICRDIDVSSISDLKDKVEYYKVDLSDAEAVDKVIRTSSPSAIIHMAANVNLDRHPDLVDTMMANNFQTTLNIYRAALNLKGLKCIITSGTVEEYGQNDTPFVETQKELPISPYSLSKTCVTHLSSYFQRIHNLPLITVRPFLTYGERQINQMIPFVIRSCLNNETLNMTKGEQTRDFIYVKDVVSALITIVQNYEKVIGEILNICTGKETSIKDAVLLIKKLTESDSEINFGALEYRKGENMHFHGSNDKISTMLGWTPEYIFEDGIKNTIDWFKGVK